MKSPPRARLAFRVGVVGHRPNRLKDADLGRLAELIREILEMVQVEVANFRATSPDAKLYSGEKPILRAITPMAEGTDRIFADQAIQLGYDLCVPMPFPQEEYERDFITPSAEKNSLDHFRCLLMKARKAGGLTIFQLDGERAHEGEAYGAAGGIVLNQSDLLVVVWDGDKPAGVGGTVETLREAVQYRVPVLWICALQPHVWRVLKPGDNLECLEGKGPCIPVQSPLSLKDAVGQVVRDEIALPPVLEPVTHGKKPEDAVSAQNYFAERKPRLHLAVLWKFFRELAGSSRLTWPALTVRDYEAELIGQWPCDSGANHAAHWVNKRLLPHYAWADKLADHYADAYRSTYLFIYLSAAFAVLLALLPMAAGWEERSVGQAFCVAGEFIILALITGLLVWERNRRWHKRWMAYRLLAELVRQLRCLLPLGGGRPLPRVAGHLSLFGDPARTWMYWQLRAIARATGIPAVNVTRDYVGECLDSLDQLVRGPGSQRYFHVQNQERSERLNHRLHLAALWMFALTLVCIAIHLLPHLLSWISLPAALDRWLTLACATLPAFGAAMGGISNQGEFVRIAKRSESMADQFNSFAMRIDGLKTPKGLEEQQIRIGRVTPLAREITQLMVNEVVEWRILFIDRPATAA